MTEPGVMRADGPPDGPDPEFKYWAFISYSHRDKAWGDWLHKKLETYRVPRLLVGRATPVGQVPARLFPVFRDREELPVSMDLGANIRNALNLSRNLVVICSPHAARSAWVNEEVRAFKAMGRASRIQALIVAGEPNSGGSAQEGQECFPPSLRFAGGGEGHLSGERTEPIAADMRPGMEGKENAKLRLISGLLGVDFDELRQRDRVRRQRRRASIALAVAAVAVGGLSLWQYQARRADERLEAQKRRAFAQQAEERGRAALLRGAVDVAEKELEEALAAAPDRAAARLMLGVARRAAGDAVNVLTHAESNVLKMALSPRGTHLLTIGIDSEIAALWDLSTRRVIRRIGGLGDVNAVFSANGEKLLIAHDHQWAIHDIAGGGEVLLPGGPGTLATFLGGGDRVLWYESAFGDGESIPPSRFVIYEASDGRELRRFELGPGSAAGVSSSRDGRSILLGWFSPAPKPSGVRLWVGEPRLKWVDVDSGRVIVDLPRDNSGYMELSPDGERLLYLRADGRYEVRSKVGSVWSTPERSGSGEAHWSHDGRAIVVDSLGVLDAADGTEQWKMSSALTAIDPSGAVVAEVNPAGAVSVRSMSNGELLNEFTNLLDRSTPGGLDHLALFSLDGANLFLAGGARTVKIWDWRRARSEFGVIGVRGGSSRIAAASFSGDGALLAMVTEECEVSLWDVASRRRRAQLQTPHRGGGSISFAFSPDGRQLLTSCTDYEGTGKVWDTGSGRLVATIDDGVRTVNEGSPGEVQVRVAWGDGRLVTANYANGFADLWDEASLRKVSQFPLGSPMLEIPVACIPSRPLTMSADGSRVAAAGTDGSARIFSLRDAKIVSVLAHPFPNLSRVELSADGAIGLTVDDAGHAVTWNAELGKKLATLEAGAARMNEVRLGLDGRRAAAACSDGWVRIWDTQSGALLFTLREEQPPGEGVDTLGAGLFAGDRLGVLDVQFDPQGYWLAGVDDNGRVCVWELDSGRQLLRWKIEPNRSARLAASPNGRTIAVFGLPGAALVFDLTPVEEATGRL